MPVKHAQPNLSQSQVCELMKRLYNLTAAEMRPLPSYDDQNLYVAPCEGGEFVLKIMNSEHSKNITIIEVQTHAMSFLHQNGLPVQTAVPTASGQLMSLEEMGMKGADPSAFITASIINRRISSRASGIDQLAGKKDFVRWQMEHPHLSILERENFIWSLSNVSLLKGYLNVLDGDPLQEAVKSVITQYEDYVIPKRPNFRKCINHGDFNDLNVLVQPDDNHGYKISGILDFGDMNSGYYVFELAITIMYMMIEHPDPIQVGGPVLAGWESVFPLNQDEKDCLYLLVLSRFCQSLVMARYSVTLHPENEEYLMITSRKGVKILQRFWELGKKHVEKVWFQHAAEFNKTMNKDVN
ncbi:PREDICTED: hydroxylysine kinase [Cyprinodon variegatus]|uniref:hydroxylysine kinase n=1 Tax=Cyprinodon variegatus TaxID=28743 RepID=UPI0007427F27|nr:PREDICTED: hydroxylysine kinase [Cyprinodon variegatus]